MKFGLHAGSADLIGWKTITITPHHVGREIAVFVSVEVKTPTGKVSPAQENWRLVVRQAGGIAVIARSPEEAQAALQ